MLPTDIMQNEIACSLSFKDAINVRKTSKFFNGCFNYNHDPRLDNQCAIKLAVRHGNVDAIKCLLEVKYVDPTTDNNSPIKMAISNGNVEVVKTLLDSGKVDASVENNYPILKASEIGALEMVTFLLDYPKFDLANENVTGALFIALKNRHDDVASLMLSKIPLTNGEFIMSELSYFSEQGVEMVINDGNINMTNYRETGSKLSRQ
jgi:ankyrin repeat protein